MRGVPKHLKVVAIVTSKKTEDLAYVTGRFDCAKVSGQVQINLYYSPYRKRFNELAEKVTVYGINIGLYKYKDHLYKVRAGPGDCEELLCHMGKCSDTK